MANGWYQSMASVFGYSNAYYLYNALTGIPVLGSVLKAYDDSTYLSDYFGNTGLDYSDIRYPTHAGSTGAYSSLGSAGYSFVSENISRLYR